MAGLTSYLQSLFQGAAAQTGVSADYFSQVANIESGYNPSAQSSTSSAGGLFQFIDSTWANLGGGNKYDAATNVNAMASLTSQNLQALTAGLGTTPTNGQLYLAHQQGISGALGLLQNPNALASSIVGTQAVVNNGGTANMTAGQFASLWTSKFDGSSTSTGTGSALLPGRQSTNVEDLTGTAADGNASAGGFFVRGAVIVTGFIFLAVGLAMFKGPAAVLMPGPIKGAAKALS